MANGAGNLLFPSPPFTDNSRHSIPISLMTWESLPERCAGIQRYSKGLRDLSRLLPSDEVITLRQVGGVLGAVLQLCSIMLEIPLIHSPGPPSVDSLNEEFLQHMWARRVVVCGPLRGGMWHRMCALDGPTEHKASLW
ncbi:hypothetical protein Q8A73_003023 [Channa argus]|nr:hypothetical protein Q8A73_003023 [Channa argus]